MKSPLIDKIYKIYISVIVLVDKSKLNVDKTPVYLKEV